MRIGFHAKVLSQKKLTGIGYYTYNLLKQLLVLDKENEYLLFSSKPNLHSLTGAKEICKSAPLGLNFSYFGYPWSARAFACDLHVFPTEMIPFGLKSPSIITIFDLFYLIYPPEIRSKIPLKANMQQWLAKKIHLKRAEKIIAISEDTKKTIIEVAGISPNKIHVVYPGYDPDLFYPSSAQNIQAVQTKYGISKPYFVNVSSVWWERKNLCRLIQAFADLKKNGFDCQLVIAGKRGPSLPEMQKMIEKFSLQQEIKLLEYVSLSDMPHLLSGAIALVFPSLHEGFGLPIVEAMGCGCPVITANVSAMPEAGGDAALYVNPLDCSGITQAMEKMANNPFLRGSLIKQGIARAASFTWQSSAKKNLEIFCQL